MISDHDNGGAFIYHTRHQRHQRPRTHTATRDKTDNMFELILLTTFGHIYIYISIKQLGESQPVVEGAQCKLCNIRVNDNIVLEYFLFTIKILILQQNTNLNNLFFLFKNFFIFRICSNFIKIIYFILNGLLLWTHKMILLDLC